jgi:raffinose/stachyose/melibiose transport system substrate-binding protein
MDASNAYIGGAMTLFLTYPLSASTDAGAPDWPAKHKAGKVSFSKSGWVTALQRFMQLYQSGYFSPNATGGAPLSQLANGEAAMYTFVSQGIPTVKTAFGVGNVGAFVLPNANTASKVIASSGSGYGLSINAKTKNPAGAKGFVNTVTSPLGQKVYNALLGGVPLLPSRPGAVPQAFAPLVMPVLRAGRVASYYDQLWPNAAVQTALIVGCQALMTGQQNISDVLGAMDAAYNQK